jgi:hypothetical protein
MWRGQPARNRNTGRARTKEERQMAETPKKVNDKWHRLAARIIRPGSTIIDLAADADDPDGDTPRYCYATREFSEGDVLLLASNMRRTAAKGAPHA